MQTGKVPGNILYRSVTNLIGRGPVAARDCADLGNQTEGLSRVRRPERWVMISHCGWLYIRQLTISGPRVGDLWAFRRLFIAGRC